MSSSAERLARGFSRSELLAALKLQRVGDGCGDGDEGFFGLPTEMLSLVLSFADLRGVAASAATSPELRDCVLALSPGIQHGLVVRTVFPILSTLDWDGAAALSPRELYLSQKRVEAVRPVPEIVPTVGLEEYVFSLEVFEANEDGTRQKLPHHVGTGMIYVKSETVAISWTIPYATFERLYLSPDDSLQILIMCSRRGTLERAVLYQGGVDDSGDAYLQFEWFNIPHEDEGAKGRCLSWLHKSPIDGNEPINGNEPHCEVFWSETDTNDATSTLTAKFLWVNEHDCSEMSAKDTCLMLEHWAAFAA